LPFRLTLTKKLTQRRKDAEKSNDFCLCASASLGEQMRIPHSYLNAG